MTQENADPETEAAVHHATRKAADTSLAKRQISPDSHRAVLAGELSLEEARELGREGSPFGSAPKTANKNDRSRTCLCGCGGTSKTGRFQMGHDTRMVALAKAYVRGEAEPDEEQLAYVRESGKLDRARLQVQKEERKRQEAAARKAERQRQREGEAAAKKAKGEKS